MTYLTLGIDIGKHSFSCCLLHTDRSIAQQRTFTRAELFKFLDALAAETTKEGQLVPVAMEACGSSSWLAEEIETRGFPVKLIHARYVKPYLTARQKNDERDAHAIAKASLDPELHPVAIKRADQRAVTNLHKVRERLVGTRTALVNQMRSMLWEEGLTPRQGRKWFEWYIKAYLDDHREALHPTTFALLQSLILELRDIGSQIEGIETEIEGCLADMPVARALMTIPGIGLMNATALAAHVGDAKRFKSGRDMAAWLGLVPRQSTTGGRQMLGRITKAGNGYLRKLLVHGARSLLAFTRATDHPMVQWAQGLRARGMGINQAATALANKLARLCWAIMAKGTSYRAKG